MEEVAERGTSLTYEIVSIKCGGPGFTAPGEDLVFRQLGNRCNHYSPCQMYQQALDTDKSDIIMYAHDDLHIHEEHWLTRVLDIFDEDVAAVGLGGATRLGHLDVAKKPYFIDRLARAGYYSNQDDAEVHGERFTGVKEVAVLDAFFMAIRRDTLLQLGGWPVNHITHHCLDLWLACVLARAGLKTKMVGISCLHRGGGTSITGNYSQAKWLQGGTTESDHAIPHRWIYDEFIDVLPIGTK